MIRRSGGFNALISYMSKSSLNGQRAQLIFFAIGLVLFFDQYASSVIGGELSSAIVHVFPVSVEKLAFIIDSTAAPVASIFPVSSWASVAVPLIQVELDRIVSFSGTDDLYIVTSGFEVLLKSLKYQFYPLFMILLVLMGIWAKRDMGPMLIAERSRYVRHMLGFNDPRPAVRRKQHRNEKRWRNEPGRMSSVVIPMVVLNVFMWYCYGVYAPNALPAEDYPGEPLMAMVASIAATVILAQILYLWQQRTPNGPMETRDKAVWYLWPLQVMARRNFKYNEPADQCEIPRVSVVVSSFVSQMKSEMQSSKSKGTDSKESSEHELADNGLEVELTTDIEVKRCNDTSDFGSTSFLSGNVVVHDSEVEETKNKSQSTHTNMMITEIEEQMEEVEVMKSNNPSTHTDIILTDIEDQKEDACCEAPREGHSGDTCSFHSETKKLKSLLSVQETITCFSESGSRILYMLILLTLVWAMRIVFTQIGFDRAFADYLATETIEPEHLPGLAFAIALVISLIVRSAVGTITILLPVVTIPAYELSFGNPELFYGVIGALFSGAIAGEHVSPISDSSMLTCLATKCEITSHTLTQIPYAFFTSLVAFTAGTYAVSHDAYPVYVAYLIGILFMFFYVFICCCPIIEPGGNYDIFTEIYRRCFKSKHLKSLKISTTEVYKIEQEVLTAKEKKEALLLALTGEMATSSSEESDGYSDDSSDETIGFERREGSQGKESRSKVRSSRSTTKRNPMESGSYLDLNESSSLGNEVVVRIESGSGTSRPPGMPNSSSKDDKTNDEEAAKESLVSDEQPVQIINRKVSQVSAHVSEDAIVDSALTEAESSTTRNTEADASMHKRVKSLIKRGTASLSRSSRRRIPSGASTNVEKDERDKDTGFKLPLAPHKEEDERETPRNLENLSHFDASVHLASGSSDSDSKDDGHRHTDASADLTSRSSHSDSENESAADSSFRDEDVGTFDSSFFGTYDQSEFGTDMSFGTSRTNSRLMSKQKDTTTSRTDQFFYF